MINARSFLIDLTEIGIVYITEHVLYSGFGLSLSRNLFNEIVCDDVIQTVICLRSVLKLEIAANDYLIHILEDTYTW